ncbi:hypothetical protein TURU_117045 [Turdus rufiventris]|nr:hypothetical protein TURU_117045 [Turdus rufiventris]
MEVMDEKLDTSWQWAPTGLESQMCPGLPPKKCGQQTGLLTDFQKNDNIVNRKKQQHKSVTAFYRKWEIPTFDSKRFVQVTLQNYFLQELKVIIQSISVNFWFSPGSTPNHSSLLIPYRRNACFANLQAQLIHNICFLCYYVLLWAFLAGEN